MTYLGTVLLVAQAQIPSTVKLLLQSLTSQGPIDGETCYLPCCEDPGARLSQFLHHNLRDQMDPVPSLRVGTESVPSSRDEATLSTPGLFFYLFWVVPARRPTLLVQ